MINYDKRGTARVNWNDVDLKKLKLALQDILLKPIVNPDVHSMFQHHKEIELITNDGGYLRIYVVDGTSYEIECVCDDFSRTTWGYREADDCISYLMSYFNERGWETWGDE